MSPRLTKADELLPILIKNFPDQETRNLIDYTVELLQSDFHLSRYESYRIAERLENNLRSRIDEYISDCLRRGIIPKFSFSELNPDRLVGRCFAYKTDSTEAKRFKKKLLLYNEIMDYLLELSWDDFEQLCRKLNSLDLRKCYVRRRRRNGGIDFQGRYQLSPTTRLSFAGQAKKYARNRKIGPNLIRELAGSMSRGQWAFGIFMTTAKFTPGAIRIGGQKNIECIDGEQITFEIIRNGLGIIENNNIIFDLPTFKRWLHG